jgi:hypothetical protein
MQDKPTCSTQGMPQHRAKQDRVRGGEESVAVDGVLVQHFLELCGVLPESGRLVMTGRATDATVAMGILMKERCEQVCSHLRVADSLSRSEKPPSDARETADAIVAKQSLDPCCHSMAIGDPLSMTSPVEPVNEGSEGGRERELTRCDRSFGWL